MEKCDKREWEGKMAGGKEKRKAGRKSKRKRKGSEGNCSAEARKPWPGKKNENALREAKTRANGDDRFGMRAEPTPNLHLISKHNAEGTPQLEVLTLELCTAKPSSLVSNSKTVNLTNLHLKSAGSI